MKKVILEKWSQAAEEKTGACLNPSLSTWNYFTPGV
jgi:hypothetical protein